MSSPESREKYRVTHHPTEALWLSLKWGSAHVGTLKHGGLMMLVTTVITWAIRWRQCKKCVGGGGVEPRLCLQSNFPIFSPSKFHDNSVTLKLSLNNFGMLVRWWQYSQWINYRAKWSQVTNFYSYISPNWLITLFSQNNKEEPEERS